MFDKLEDADTIAAISTAPGVGGIAVLRVSGDRAFEIGRKLCAFLPIQPESHRIYYGLLKSPADHRAIDEVLVSCFINGRSFTGEETIEISCHGSPVLTSSILSELVASGARLARPGEFTYRAFMNGRIDLVQAESVLSLIESQSKQSAKIALRQLQGALSTDFRRIEDDLIWILAQLEASIDFSAEDIEVIPSKVLSGRTLRLVEFLDRLIGTYHSGRIIKDGLQVALVGAPNAGKSSLLNALLREDRAIVTPHEGTTRDLVEGRLSVDGVAVTLVDTAGIRETSDEIERMGIAKSHRAKSDADIVFFLIDVGHPEWRAMLESALADDVSGTLNSRYYLFNKIDLLDSGQLMSIQMDPMVQALSGRALWISVNSQAGLEDIEAVLRTSTATVAADDQSTVTHARHLEGLEKIRRGLNQALTLIESDSSPEFIAFELQDAVRVIHELLGQEFDEQVIDRIFKEFCLGK